MAKNRIAVFVRLDPETYQAALREAGRRAEARSRIVSLTSVCAEAIAAASWAPKKGKSSQSRTNQT
jgi:hypothetical protein